MKAANWSPSEAPLSVHAQRVNRAPPASFDPHLIRASCPRIMSAEIRTRILCILFLALTQTTVCGQIAMPEFSLVSGKWHKSQWPSPAPYGGGCSSQPCRGWAGCPGLPHKPWPSGFLNWGMGPCPQAQLFLSNREVFGTGEAAAGWAWSPPGSAA